MLRKNDWRKNLRGLLLWWPRTEQCGCGPQRESIIGNRNGGFSIVSLRPQDKPTSEEYQLDNLPDDELADLGEVDADSSDSEYSRLAKIMCVLT